MQKLLLDVLFLTILSGDGTLSGKLFIFHESDTAYVSLIPRVKKPLQNFTLCLKAFTDMIRPYSLFSYSIQSQANELLLFVNKMGEYGLSIENVDTTFKAPESPYAPIHICANWESASRIAELWVNGKPVGREGLKKGYSVGAEAKIILGKEPDSFGRKFDIKQSLIGVIWNVSLWDRMLSLKEMGASCYNGKLLNWQVLHYEDSGYVVIKPKVWV
ncbi:LOW QUALITY PROTEIN: mucosal pentraxin-like [Dugong dugon]